MDLAFALLNTLRDLTPIQMIFFLALFSLGLLAFIAVTALTGGGRNDPA